MEEFSNSPIAASDYPMKFWFALFAKVLVRKIALVDQAHAATVLPNGAEIALHKEVAQVVAEGFQYCASSAILASSGYKM